MVDPRAVQDAPVGDHHRAGRCIDVDRRWQLADRLALAERLTEDRVTPGNDERATGGLVEVGDRDQQVDRHRVGGVEVVALVLMQCLGYAAPKRDRSDQRSTDPARAECLGDQLLDEGTALHDRRMLLDQLLEALSLVDTRIDVLSARCLLRNLGPPLPLGLGENPFLHHGDLCR